MNRIGIADLHLSGYSSDSPKNGLPQRLYDLFNSLRQVVSFARENNITNIDILGDINNDKDIFYTKPFILFRDFIRETDDLFYTFLSGNHDMDSASDDQVSSIENFRELKNARVITSIEYDEELGILWMPFTKQIAHSVKAAPQCNILLSHFGVNEAQMSSGISIVADVSLKDLAKFKLVLLGHYHKPQNIKNVWSVGNLFQNGWGEKGEEKRFVVYNTDTLKVESVPVHGYMKHIELVLQDPSDIKQLLEESKKLKIQGNKVRIKNLSGSEVTHEDIQIINKVEKDITDRGLDIGMSDEEIHKGYLRIKKIEDERFLEIGKLLCGYQDLKSIIDYSDGDKPLEQTKKKIEEVQVDFDF